MFDSFVYNDKEQNSKKDKYMKLVTKYMKLVLKPNLSTFVQDMQVVNQNLRPKAI